MAIDDNASYELTGYQVKDLASKIRAKADSNSLASVATSGLYSDLTGAPTIPTVYNGTLTIQQNGTTLGTFSANQDTNETINITGGGGATVTTVYQNGWSGTFCKDDQLSESFSSTELLAALEDGQVILYDIDDDTAYNAVQYGLAYSYFYMCFVSPKNQKSYLAMALSPQPAGDRNFQITETTYQKNLTAGTNITITNGTISATDTTYSDFTGATSSVAGAHGLVPAPAAGDEAKALHGDGTWKDTTAKLVEMSYGESNAWTKFINAYNAGSIVYCRASSNANPATGSQTRKAFMAYVNNATSPTNVEFQYVRSQSSKTDSQQCDQVFVYKLTNASGGTWTVESRNMAPKIVAGTGMSSTFTTGANATITLNAEPDYSASEVDTKVKWVDGKTIYRKTINFGSLPDTTSKTVAHGVSNLSKVIKMEGYAYRSSDGTFFPIPFASEIAAQNNITLTAGVANVVVSTGMDRSNIAECYITIYYTKSS